MRSFLALSLALALPLFAVAQASSARQGTRPAARGEQAPAAAPKQPAKQKLVMKDGSDQVVRAYERRGDRVRYYSVERDEWEEVPASLVDWKATEQANREEQAGAIEKAQEAARAEQAARDELLGPEIAPGVRLPPDADGLFVVESGKLVELPRQQASAKVDKGRVATNVLLPIPVLKNRNLVQIPGSRAAIRLQTSPPALFAAGRAREDSRYALARLKPKGDARQVEAILTNFLGRNPTHSGEYIELDTQTVAPGLFRLVPRRSLPAGEYAIVEFLGNDLNMFMWDFAVEK